MTSIQVEVDFEIQRWPQGATGVEVELVEADYTSGTVNVPVSPEPIVLSRHDISRRALREWCKQVGSMMGNPTLVGWAMRSYPQQFTVSSVLWCDKPCTNGICTLHGDAGKDASEGDNRFELDARVRIYGTRGDAQRVTLAERWAKARVDVYCASCPP